MTDRYSVRSVALAAATRIAADALAALPLADLPELFGFDVTFKRHDDVSPAVDCQLSQDAAPVLADQLLALIAWRDRLGGHLSARPQTVRDPDGRAGRWFVSALMNHTSLHGVPFAVWTMCTVPPEIDAAMREAATESVGQVIGAENAGALLAFRVLGGEPK